MDISDEKNLSAIKAKILELCEITEQDNAYLERNIAIARGNVPTSDDLSQLLLLENQLYSCQLRLIHRRLLHVRKGRASVAWKVHLHCPVELSTHLHLNFVLHHSTSSKDVYSDYEFSDLKIVSYSSTMTTLVELYGDNVFQLLSHFAYYCHLADVRYTALSSHQHTTDDGVCVVQLENGAGLGWEVRMPSDSVQFQHRLFVIGAGEDEIHELPEEFNRRLLENHASIQSILIKVLSRISSLSA